MMSDTKPNHLAIWAACFGPRYDLLLAVATMNEQYLARLREFMEMMADDAYVDMIATRAAENQVRREADGRYCHGQMMIGE